MGPRRLEGFFYLSEPAVREGLLRVKSRRTFEPASRFGKGSQGQLPISDINPSTKLESDLRELSHFAKTEFLMQGDAGDIGQRNAADGDM
jgi:hypothetical protein